MDDHLRKSDEDSIITKSMKGNVISITQLAPKPGKGAAFEYYIFEQG